MSVSGRDPPPLRVRRVAVRAIPFALCLAAAGASAAPETSGLPLPRFVSLRAGEVNMRAGPGLQYPVEWVYRRRALPVEVTAEFHHWRRVRDREGTEGWIHRSLLSGARTAEVIGDVRTLREEAEPGSPPVARAEPGVVGAVIECRKAGPCRLVVGDVEGWLERSSLWGVYPSETIE